MTTTKTYGLNAKAIKKALIREGVKVLSCKKGTGSVAGSANIVTSSDNLKETVAILANFGIVTRRGQALKAAKTSQNYFDFGYCYMSEEMYNEINE